MRIFAKSTSHLIIWAITLGCTLRPIAATEKYWIAHEAQLIVIGTFHPGPGFWWLDGWHETGTITVNEVLYGQPLAGPIEFRLTDRCTVSWWNRWRPTHFMNPLTNEGLWFLRRLGEEIWEPANGCDIGYRLMAQRADFERYIRSEKH